MIRKSGFVIGLLALAATLGASGGATATTAGTTAQGERFVSGGVADERDAMEQPRHGEFNLKVVTAANGSGRFLAGVGVTITDTSGRPVLDTMLDGPYLLVELKPGQYTVQASHAGQSFKTSTTIAAGGHREIGFYFDVPVDTESR